MKKVLIVDDSVTERFIVKKALSKLKIEILEAEDGEEGVLMALEHHPDLIIMDVVMPKMDGLTAVRNILKEPSIKDIPIVICSSKGSTLDVAWGKMQGAREYVTKPINEKDLLSKIKTLLGIKTWGWFG